VYTLLRFKNLLFLSALCLVVLLLAAGLGVEGGALLTAAVKTDHAPEENEIQVPIIMYHSLLKSRSEKFVLSPGQFELDLQYIRARGFHTVTINNLIEYVHHDIPLPEKPLVITLDDGFLNNITYALPLLEKYRMCAVLSVVGSYTDKSTASDDHNPAYAYVTWEDVRALIHGGVLEIQNHSYALHRNANGRCGAKPKRGEREADYRKTLRTDINAFEEAMEANTGYRATAFIYPFGQFSALSEKVLQEEGFLASLSCRERIPKISKDPESLYQMGRFNRPSGITTEEFFEKVLKKYEG